MIIILFGPQAVGKMTVGQMLAKEFSLALVHNHMVIDIAESISTYGSAAFYKARRALVHCILEETNFQKKATLLTRTYNFNNENDINEIRWLVEFTIEHRIELAFVGLNASLHTRLQRNESPNRLKHKPSKRNITLSRERLIQSHTQFRYFPNDVENNLDFSYLYLETDETTPYQVAKNISDNLGLSKRFSSKDMIKSAY